MRKFTKIFVLFLCIIAISNKSNAAIDIYMKIVGQSGVLIKGESIVKGFENDVEITALGQTSLNPITTTGGTTTTGRFTIGDFSFQTALNSASQTLMSYMATGQRLESVDIYYVKAGSNCTCSFYRIHMENVFVSSVADASNDENVQEQITFTPTQVAWAYYKQDPTGAYPTKPTATFGWDKSKNNVYSYAF